MIRLRTISLRKKEATVQHEERGTVVIAGRLQVHVLIAGVKIMESKTVQEWIGKFKKGLLLLRESSKLEAERQGGQKRNRGRDVLLSPAKPYSGAPRVFELSEEDISVGNIHAIIGMLLSTILVNLYIS